MKNIKGGDRKIGRNKEGCVRYEQGHRKEKNKIRKWEKMLRWGKEEIKGFSSPVKKAEEVNDWAWWSLFVIVVTMGVLFVLKISGKI